MLSFKQQICSSNIRKVGDMSNFSMKSRTDEDDLDSIGMMKPNLPYAVDTSVSNMYSVPIDEDIQEPSYYRNVLKMLQDATQYDFVKFVINSNGGRLDGLSSILHGVKTTQAQTIAEIVGDCHSAASILALSCDQVIVGDYASMLCHSARWGFVGKSSDVVGHTLHNKKISDRLMREAYKDFLSEKEIDRVLEGHELYLDSDDIAERLSQRDEIRGEQEVQEEFTTQEIEEVVADLVESKRSKRSKQKE